MGKTSFKSYEDVAKSLGLKSSGKRNEQDKFEAAGIRVIPDRESSTSPQLARALNNARNVRMSNFADAEERINNWITGDRTEDISADIEAYERALEALKRYGKDTKAASEWIAGVRADNNAVVRQNLIDDIGEAKDSRKGTLWDFAKATVSNIGATSRGDTAAASKAQQEAIAALNRRSTSKQQQRDAEAALAAHREKYGQNLVASEILEQAYKDEDEAIRVLRGNNQSNRNFSINADKVKEAEEKLEAAQKTITDLGGKVNANWMVGGLKQSGGQTVSAAAWLGQLATEFGSRVDEQLREAGVDSYTVGNSMIPGKVTVPATDDAAKATKEVMDKAQQFGIDLSTSGAMEIEAAKAGKSAAEQILIDIGVQAQNMATDAVANAVAPGAGMAMLGTRAFGGGVQTAYEQGASTAKAGIYAAAVTGAEVLSEKVTGLFSIPYGKGAADGISDYFIGKMASTELGRQAWGMLASGLGEGLEEGITAIIEPFADSIINNKSVWENLSDLEAGDVFYQMFIGAVLGYAGAGVQGLTQGQSAEANFFRNAAEAGLSLKQASKIWAETEMDVLDAKTIRNWSQTGREQVVQYGQQFDEGTAARTLADRNEGKKLRASNVQAQDLANQLTRYEGHKTAREKEAERIQQEMKAEREDLEFFQKLTTRSQANKLLFDEERLAEFKKRTGLSLEGKIGEQAKAIMAESQKRVKEIEQRREQRANEAETRRKDAEAARAKTAVAELDTGDVALNEKGETVVDGKVVDMSVKETLQKMGFSEARAEDIAKQYDPNTATKGEFAKAMRSTYLMARAAVPEGEINAFVDKATPQQRQIAAAYGDADRVNAAKAAQEAVKAKVGDTVVRGEGGIINDTGRSIDLDTLDAPRKAGYQMAQALAKAVGNNVHLFESVERGGKRVLAHDVGPYKAGDDAPNGWYDHSTGDIYVDINAGERGQGTILYTLSHEYTHFIRQWSPEKFETLAKFLFDNADISIEAAIQNQMDKAARAGRDIDRDKAMEEVVADAMEAMLSDTNAAEKIIELRNRDKGLWEKLKELITKIRNAVRAAYKDFAPDSHEGLMLKRMDESLTEKLSTLFAEGVADAAENYSRAAEYVSAETAQKLADHGLTIVDGIVTTGDMADLIEKEGVEKPVDYTDVSHSYRTTPDWANSFYERFGRTTETERVVNEMLAFTERMVATEALQNYVPMGEYAYSKYGPLRGNMEYLYTFDMDTTCPRTFQFLAYRDALQKIAKRPLTYRESVNLLEVMRAYGQMIPCSYCFVENKRVLLSASYNNFFTFRNNVMNAATDAEAKPMMYGYNAKKKTLAKAAEEVFKKWRSDRSYNPTISECWDDTCVARNSVLNWLDANFNTESGKAMSANKLANLVSEHFGISEKGAVQEIKRMVDDWVYDVNAGKDHMYDVENDTSVSRVNEKALTLHHEAMAYSKSASSAKSVENYVPYTDQLKNISEAERSFIMGMGGIRKHSSNDFRIDYVQDYMLFYADLAAGKWTGHTYTKSADFVKIFANTKDRINMSIAFYGDTADMIRENQDEGAAWNDARQLRGAYDNVGVMAMVTSDAQLTYALNSNWVDMIIPFHASGLDKKVWYNLRMWNDYTKFQLEKPINSKEKRAALREAGVSVPSNARAAEISNLYDQTFNTLHIYDESGKVKRPHFLPGDTEVNGQIVPGHHNDVQRYFELCRQYGVHPRFYGVKVQDANGNTIDVTEHPNYLKLIKETARTDTQQEAIEFNFDKYDANLGMTPFEYAMKRLEEEANNGGFQNTKEDPYGIVKEFAEEYLDKDRPLGYLTERAKTTRDIKNGAYDEMQGVGAKVGGDNISLSGRNGVDDQRSNSFSSNLSFSLRNQPTTDRYVLTNAEGQNDTETRILARYREEYGVLVGLEETLEAQRETLKELRGSEIKDKDVLRAQREAIMATENRINIQQGILSRMEDSATLQRVLKREREIEIHEGYERGRFDQGYETAPQIRKEMTEKANEEFLKGYERGRFDQGIKMAEEQSKAMEYAEKKTGDRISRLEARLAEAEAEERRRAQQLKDYRQNASRKELLRKIGKTTDTLKKWLKHPDPKDHIPSDLMNVVVEALDAVNMDTVNADERLAIIDRRIAEVNKALSVTTEYANRKRLEDEKAKLVRQQGIINRQGYKMREKLSELQSVYNETRNSDDPVLAGAYDEDISAKIQEVWEYVGDTSLRDMRVDQLQMVYNLYRMVITRVRNANKAFRAAKNATIEELATLVMKDMAGKAERGAVMNIRNTIEKLVWTDMKPVYAFKTIGSETMTNLFNAVRAGEDIWAKDVSEAREFYLEETRKHNANSWDMEKKYSFTSTSGLNFELTLGDIMSIYAYSKREQALDHLAKGGIVLEPPTDKKGPFSKVSENATAYNLSPEIIAEITGKLTSSQKAFVDAMQRYLSTDMGNKGNEVSEALYDVKLFTEENYFPLRSSSAYMARVKDQQKGEVRIKNSGFTKATTPNASNPIVMQPFMEVWSEHVSDMAMYHAFTLPLEDFYRVYNFKTAVDETSEIESVNKRIQNVYGKAAIDYIDTLLRDINGGARGDKSFTAAARAFSKFKKASVMASASVVVQQPSAIARAFNYIPVTYFIGPKVNADTHDRVWDELKKYAPIAVIKEIGSFDQNAGKRTVDWIGQKQYGTFMEKVGAFFTDNGFRDDAFGYLAGKADEITWCAIWEASKRMAQDTTKLQGEALLQKAGEIFTETVVNTQVYDSVMSRSQLMRSKDGMAQMLTAFMGEPTTTLNMLYDAVLQGKRGDYGYAAKTIGSVTASIALNAALVSFVKAARDDDEDESYWEKYMAAMFSAFRDGIDVRQMIPYVRDLVSLGKGFDVERTDVSVYSDVMTAWNKLMNAREEDEATAKEYIDLLANFGNLLGIPATNLIRDGRAVRNVIAGMDEKSTAAGIRDAIREGWTGERKSDGQQLYEALMAGDTKQIERVTGRYETQKEADADVRKYLREADSRIAEAALARFEGRTADYESIITDILNEGKLSRNVVVEAIRAEEEKLDEDTVSTDTKISSLYTQDDLVQAMKTGNNNLAHRIRDDIVATAKQNGKTVNEAQRQFRGNAQTAAKEAYIDGSIPKHTAQAILKNYSEKSADDASDIIRAWDFEKKNGWIYSQRGTEFKDGNITRSQLKTAMTTYGGMKSDEAELAIKVYEWEMDGITNASDAMIRDYTKEGVEAAGISREVWAKAWYIKYNTKGEDADGDGKTDTNSALKNCMPLINELPISAEEKTFIATRFWSKANVNKYKTW